MSSSSQHQGSPKDTTTIPGGPSRNRPSHLFAHSNLSDTSIESSALLDHREQQSMRPRRSSTQYPSAAAFSGSRLRVPAGPSSMSTTPGPSGSSRRLNARGIPWEGGSDDEGEGEDAPLLGSSMRSAQGADIDSPVFSGKSKRSRPSTAESIIPPPDRRSANLQPASAAALSPRDYGGVNFPPSVPGSPGLAPMPMLGLMGAGDYTDGLGMPSRSLREGDAIINITGDATNERGYPDSTCITPPQEFGPGHRQATAEADVCFPVDDGLTDDEVATLHGGSVRAARRRVREWPDLSVLEEWSRDEKEERSEGIRAKKTAEPVYVGGRLRAPRRSGWHREVEDEPYRFTYFNDELPATIHSHTISELLQPGQTFKDLFPAENGSTARTSPRNVPRPVRIGPRSTFWLDVMNPTDAEMKVFIRAFGIHPLTSEDIMMQETREKVELFRSYYLVSYRTFEQDTNSEEYLEPVNIYFVVFREGVISFHFSLTPHPANVRRRIRQLRDYITVSADWISYALIDDITDAFAPLIQSLEEEVDEIDDAILQMHLTSDSDGTSNKSIAGSVASDGTEQKSDGEMLKRVGDTRKKVMGLYRLLGNKADVIKGFAKRCNEQWEVAPRSEIGLYLGDIQDHIVTMVGNLNHMEKILSRSHSNYLAQINIKMNERQEQTADVLGRLTVLGTIVLPMNIITGLWGMNVMVPGQEIENLNWFWCITAGLLVFGFLCYFIAKRVYKIM
ncbi:cora-domain-containing protein [Choiromyces venosus 120613-1]|uniref:Cora-domain-containing protein n=1 Tax=Choiromyces venosus 120613-1 TaxID=1336337 RepID=A0A3N4JF38_9PEZI|nr:cora-domain-containing protein [Choiromyces venosus 120613-1]